LNYEENFVWKTELIAFYKRIASLICIRYGTDGNTVNVDWLVRFRTNVDCNAICPISDLYIVLSDQSATDFETLEKYLFLFFLRLDEKQKKNEYILF